MKKIRLVIIGVLLVVLSGCFPIFVPVRGGGGGHEGHGGRGGEHGERH